ncbi:MAG: hypothetical protein ACKOX0_04405 [Bacteroidota bacterium]|jgi:hypothetical protein
MRLLLVSGTLCAALSASAQSSDFVDALFLIEESSMIRAVNAQSANLTDLTFYLMAPNVPGAAYPAVPNQTMYLQYTSVKTAAPDDQRQISVDIVGGTLPDGVSLTLTATGAGIGDFGSGHELELTSATTSGVLVDGIGSAYSGISSGQGIPVTYAVNFATQDLDASTAGVVSLQFTMSNF